MVCHLIFISIIVAGAGGERWNGGKANEANGRPGVVTAEGPGGPEPRPGCGITEEYITGGIH